MFTRRENYRPINPCEDCPAFEGMECIEVRRTPNWGPEINTMYASSMPPDPVLYAHDPNQPEAGTVVLGEDVGCVDAFCQAHEAGSSRVLGETHAKLEQCSGPTEVRVGILRRKTKTICGANFAKDVHTVARLTRIAKRQGRMSLQGAIDIIVKASSRERHSS